MGENIPRERSQLGSTPRSHENPWIMVNMKKSRSPNLQASRTCFVNHLPQSITIPEIAKIFGTHGAISDITILKNQKQPRHKFAFVQFQYPQSLITAIRDENNRIVETRAISVYPAKHDKPPYIPAKTIRNIPKQPGPMKEKKPIQS